MSICPLAVLLPPCFNTPAYRCVTDVYMRQQKVLIIEDHPQVVYTVRPTLRTLLFQVDHTQTMRHAIQMLSSILDRNLPDGDGIELLAEIQEIARDARVMMLSERGSVDQRVLGLEKGADDYLPKPFSLDEFRVRVESLMRRSKRVGIDVMVTVGPVSYDASHCCLRLHTTEQSLTVKEAKLFELFLQHPFYRVTRERIVSRLWSVDQFPTTTAVDVCVRRLRTKLQVFPLKIVTIRNIGYVLRVGT